MGEPKVSVIIPTWNRLLDLRRTLSSIFKQNYRNIEVIVIDNGSSDGSAYMVEREFPKAKLIRNKRNLGTSMAKNQGIVESKGRYLLFCDSDIEMIHSNCVRNMVRILEENSDIGAVGGEAYKLPSGKVETKKKMITLNCETSTLIMDKDDYFLEDCDYVATCNCMMPRKLVLGCGGFDSSIIYAGEDKEMGIKIKKKGYRGVVDSRCLAYHYISRTTKHRNFFIFNKNRIRIVIKNYSFLRAVSLPILDIILAFSPKKFKDVQQERVDITKWAASKAKKAAYRNRFLVTKIVKIGGEYLVSLILAYAWNIAYLPKTILERIKNPNYLEELDGHSKQD